MEIWKSTTIIQFNNKINSQAIKFNQKFKKFKKDFEEKQSLIHQWIISLIEKFMLKNWNYVYKH
jgi:hypothetical protein